LPTPAQKITTPAQTEQALLDFREAQLKDGRASETISSRIQVLHQVSQICDINDTDIIKTWLADTKNEHGFTKACTWNNRTKIKFIDTYSAYLKQKNIQWNPPKYTAKERLPFIPTELEIDQLIAGTSKTIATVLQTIKETAMRIGELTQLKPIDIDQERKRVNITPEKGSNPRILPISDKLIAMINNRPKDPRATYKTIFQPRTKTLRDYLCKQRKTIAEKLNNPRIKKISFHTLRHWKATMEYHNTKDIIHVKTFLGHKSVTSTMIYINLEQALFTETDETYTCKVAHNEQEETELINAGFTHVNNREELAFYRKRK
jgi:integrase